MQYNAPHHTTTHACTCMLQIHPCTMQSRSTQASGHRTLRVCAACRLAEGIAADFKCLAPLARDHVDGEHPADVLIARRLPAHPMHPCRHAARVQACSTCAPTHRTTIDECSNSQQSVDVLFSQKFATASGNDLMMKSWFSEFSRRVRVNDGMFPCTCMLPK